MKPFNCYKNVTNAEMEWNPDGEYYAVVDIDPILESYEARINRIQELLDAWRLRAQQAWLKLDSAGPDKT